MIAVAAMSLNRVIGHAGQIPWHLPEDFRWFKQLTLGHYVLMGRKTFDSLPKPLPNRTNIVLTKRPRRLATDAALQAKCGGTPVVGSWNARLRRPFQLGFDRVQPTRETWLVRSLPRLLAAMEKHRGERELFVIGGAQIYSQLLPRCTDLYLSVVFREVEGDAFFPAFEETFELHDVPLHTGDFEVRHFKNRTGIS